MEVISITRKEDVSFALTQIVQRDGILTPQSVVQEARDSNSPLHSLFDWDNDSAGEKYRIWQARQVINHQKVTVKDREVRQYYSLRMVEGEEVMQSYVSIEQVLSNDSLYKQALGVAVRDLESWRKKYEELAELKGVISIKKLGQVKQQIETVAI